MPIYFVRLGLWRTLWLLTELSLAGVRLPFAWAIPPSDFLRFKAGAALVAQNRYKKPHPSLNDKILVLTR
jgi:hypothetical protein